MTTPQQAPGPILSDARIAEIADATGMMAKDDVLGGTDGGRFCIDFACAIAAEVAAVPGKEPVATEWRIDSPLSNGEVFSVYFKEPPTASMLGKGATVTPLAPVGEVVAAPPEPKLTLALPDYEKRRIVIASDEVIDGERLVCVAIKGGEVVVATDLPKLTRLGWSEAYAGDTSELVEDAAGTYVRFADVERLFAALPPQAPAAPAPTEQAELPPPTGTLHDDGCFVWPYNRPHAPSYAGWKVPFYTAEQMRQQRQEGRREGIVQGYKETEPSRKSLSERLELATQQLGSQTWVWVGDGTDNLASMGNGMAVVIRADQLRALAARQSPDSGKDAPT